MEETESSPTPRPTIAELEAFFATAKLPEQFSINEGEHVYDVQKMVAAHIRTIKANPGSKANQPFLDRLLKLKEAIE